MKLMSQLSLAGVKQAQGHENILKVKKKSNYITMNWQKLYKVSCALTWKDCPAKLGLT